MYLGCNIPGRSDHVLALPIKLSNNAQLYEALQGQSTTVAQITIWHHSMSK